MIIAHSSLARTIMPAIDSMFGPTLHAASSDLSDSFDPYIIACFIIWGADRFIRVVRLVAFNHSYFGFKSGSGTLDATTELLSPEMVRLVLRRPPHFHWSPGQTAYLIMPGVSALPFEAHPFTIASFDSGSNAEEDFGGAGSFDVKEKESESSGKDTTYWKELVFLVSPRDGCTRRLLDVAAKRGTIKVFVDGPYGPSPDMRRFDTCVLIAGELVLAKSVAMGIS